MNYPRNGLQVVLKLRTYATNSGRHERMICAAPLCQPGLFSALSSSSKRAPHCRPIARSQANLASVAPAEVVPGADQQTCHFMRHGQTVMNVFLSQTPYGSAEFRDPLMCACCSACLQSVLARRVV